MKLLLPLFLLMFTDAKERGLSTLSKQVDVYPKPFSGPVSFGNVPKEGFVEPSGVSHDDVLEDLKEVPEVQRNFYSKDHRPIGFGVPRDEYLFKEIVSLNNQNDTDVDEKAPMWLDLPNLQQRNIALHLKSRTNKEISKKILPDPTLVSFNRDSRKQQHFLDNSFNLKLNFNTDSRREYNWTTCEEFGKKAIFHPQDIVDIDWVPFYIWTTKVFRSIRHRFSTPTISLVKYYKETYGPYVDERINWEEPKLLMDNFDEQLLIAADRTGLFFVIPRYELPESMLSTKMKLPTIQLRLKIEDPYLALLYCDNVHLFAALMAVAGQEPPTDEEKQLEAETIHFRAPGLGGPVVRAVIWEKARELGKQWMKLKPPKYLRVYRDYGMFPPKEVAKKHEETYPMPED